MRMNRFFIYFILTGILSGCATDNKAPSTIDWSDIDTTANGLMPSNLYGRPSDGYGTVVDDANRNIAVLLPLSGVNAVVGQTIRSSVVASVLSSAPNSLSVSFFDTGIDAIGAINSALEINPDVIIGPVFADNARMLRDIKPNNLPVLSFTSDVSALGDGVISMALMPANGVEAIIHEMSSDNIKNFIIIAPDTNSGHFMAGAAKAASEYYSPELNGVFFYQESNPESIKDIAQSASMNEMRSAANTRARVVISDILTNEQLNILEKSNLNNQLEKLSKKETIGGVPYDAVLFLGNANDSKTLASFLRYYDIAASDARFYGTTMWDGADIASDITMSGAKFATLPQAKPEFYALYEQVSNMPISRLASFGYDAMNMAIGMMYSGDDMLSYLFNPSGYNGTDGLFRIKTTGENERAVRIMQLDASGTPVEVCSAATNFITPIYNVQPDKIKPIKSLEIKTVGIDPDDYIKIPERFRDKYNSERIGANTRNAPMIEQSKIVAILPDEDSESVKTENYTPIKKEQVMRSYIEEYEIFE